jgi:lipopolysaccharide-induced tumor necrosis factor-alpha factor
MEVVVQPPSYGNGVAPGINEKSAYPDHEQPIAQPQQGYPQTPQDYAQNQQNYAQPQQPQQGYSQDQQKGFPPQNAAARNNYQIATPLASLQQGPAPVDCPVCGVREMTRTDFVSGATAQ